MGVYGSIEGSNSSFSAGAAPAAVLRPPAEGWQSGRMRRSRKPLSVVRRIEGSNPSPSASRAEIDAGNRGIRADTPHPCVQGPPEPPRPLRRRRTGARPVLRSGSLLFDIKSSGLLHWRRAGLFGRATGWRGAQLSLLVGLRKPRRLWALAALFCAGGLLALVVDAGSAGTARPHTAQGRTAAGFPLAATPARSINA